MDSPGLTPVRVNGRTIDLQRGLVRDATGQSVTLRPQAAEVLRFLVARPGVLVSKDALMEAVWPTIAVTNDSLVQCITEIRKALGDDRHQVIKTLVKRGYVFEADVQAEHDWLNGAAGAATITAGLAPGPHGEHLPTIAVLPFDDMSLGRGLSYMGEGIAEDIIAMLARSPDVIVTARNSSFFYKGQAADIRKIGCELGVNYVLEGSVRKEGDLLRIVAQLNDARTGQNLWAERFDKAGSHPWRLQDEVTGTIIASLTGELGQLKQAQYREAWEKDATALTEYDYYLRGHEVFIKAETEEENERAGQIWKEGLSKFPNSKLIKIFLGCYHFRGAWAFGTDDMATNFRVAAEIARETLAEPHLTQQVRRLGHWLLAFVLLQEKDTEGAVAQTNIAVSMGPHDAYAIVTMVEVMTNLGNYEKAKEWLATGEARDPSRKTKYHRDRAYLYRLMGQYEESIWEYEQAGPLRPWFRLSLAINYVRLGRLDEAKAIVNEALKLPPKYSLRFWTQGSATSDPAILDSELEDLARAGLPET